MDNDQENTYHYLRTWFAHTAGISVCKVDNHWPVWPDEEPFIARAVPQRRAEFATGRHCARQALQQLGFTAQALLVGPLHQPLWPHGVIGSLTHDGELCAAIVLPTQNYRGVGIDLIQKQALNNSQLLAMIVSHKEKNDCQAPGSLYHPLLLFSIKESVIKAISHSVGRFIDMREINVHLANGIFTATFPGLERKIKGHWITLSHFWLTAAVLCS